MAPEPRARPSDEDIRAEALRLAASPEDVQEMQQVHRDMTLACLAEGELIVTEGSLAEAYFIDLLRRHEIDVDRTADLAEVRALVLDQVRRDLEHVDLVGELTAGRRREAVAGADPDT